MRKAIALLTALSAVVGFGATSAVHAAAEPSQPTVPPTVPVDDPMIAPSSTVVPTAPFCPQDGESFEGYFRWNQMRNFYICMLPYVAPFFTESYGADHPMPEFVYVGYDQLYPDGCAGDPSSDHTVYAHCSVDNTIYLGAGQLWEMYYYIGDTAPFFAFAHEFGHQLQDLFISTHPTSDNPTKNKAENQADCVAGAWSAWASSRGYMELDDAGEIEVAIQSVARAEGLSVEDDEHGTLEERTNSYSQGFNGGLTACNSIYAPLTGVPVLTSKLDTPVANPNASDNGEMNPADGVVYDCLSGSLNGGCRLVTMGQTGLQVGASCSETFGRFYEAGVCAEWIESAFVKWGSNLPKLYETPDRHLTLGWFILFPQSVPIVYLRSLQACDAVGSSTTPSAGQQAWMENALKSRSYLPSSAFEPLFASSMQLVCPELGYVPDFSGSQTGTTSTTTTIPAANTAVQIRVDDGAGGTTYGSFSCASIAYPKRLIDHSQTDDLVEGMPCSSDSETYFTGIVTANPQGFDSYIYSDALSNPRALLGDVLDLAWLGWMACISPSLNRDYPGYDQVVRQVMPMFSTADTKNAWDTAFSLVCP